MAHRMNSQPQRHPPTVHNPSLNFPQGDFENTEHPSFLPTQLHPETSGSRHTNSVELNQTEGNNLLFPEEFTNENMQLPLMLPQVDNSTIGVYASPHGQQQLQDRENSLASQIGDVPFPGMAAIIITAVEPNKDQSPFFPDSPLTDLSDTSPLLDLPNNAVDIAHTANPPPSNNVPGTINIVSHENIENDSNRNINGKRPCQEENPSGRGRAGKRKRSNKPTLPGYHTFSMPVHVPMHISINDGVRDRMPINPACFAAAIASGTYLPPLLPGDTSISQPPAQEPQPPNDEDSQQASEKLTFDALTPELQIARCNTNRYRLDPFPRCVACVRKWAGDTCRFQGIRFFLRDSEKQVKGVTFVDYQRPEGAMLQFPQEWNVALRSENIYRMKFSVATGLLPLLKQEQEHMQLLDIIRRPRETDARITCDTCLTSIFSCAWMCRVCGREACSECIKHVKALTFPERVLKEDGTKKMHTNPQFLSCVKRPEHWFQDFSPVTRFCMEELDAEVSAMQQFLSEYVGATLPLEYEPPTINNTVDALVPVSVTQSRDTCSERPSSSHNKVLDTPTPSVLHVPTPPPQSIPGAVTGRYGDPLDPAEVPPTPYYIFDGEISDEQFRLIWARGQPLVVTELLQNFTIRWDPEHFISHYGEEHCLILECHTNENKSIDVGGFFEQFGKRHVRGDKCWKLKDWPPSSDFKQTFPDLYEDFINAVPVPNYTRRDGSLNIAAHFPKNSLAPDLGPKMYNAFSSSEQPGKKGTTRLHMDMADAVNIMLYSTPSPDGSEGLAAWDIYKAEDASKIRKFLKEHFKGQFVNDPIHSQTFYLDIDLRKKLYDEHGVSAWRIYQRPGDAVFIPAGCAHQVVNLADCIKVACDFVSPDNVERCSMLTREFREQNQAQTWKEDVLQLSGMMWFCWLNLRKVEKEWRNEG